MKGKQQRNLFCTVAAASPSTAKNHLSKRRRILDGDYGKRTFTLDLEKRLNTFDIHAHGLEAEPVIAECFEWGFFPWDNPKFLVFLERTIENNLTTHRKWGQGSRVRGGVYARIAIQLIPDGSNVVYLRQRLISGTGLLERYEVKAP